MAEALSDSHALVACDLYLDLRLYRVPKSVERQLAAAFPKVEIVPVNVPGASPICEGATIYWGNRITPEIINAMPNLCWIHFGSVGVNRARTAKVIERNIIVTSSKGMVVASMVASALAFITGLARGLLRSEVLRRQGKMSREAFDAYFDQAHELVEQVCLIVGYGDVGKRLGEICRVLGMKVVAIRRPQGESRPELSASYSLDELADAVRSADYVVNLLPHTTETDRIFTEEIFSAMKRTTYFINIGRGETVDEPAMIRALREGWIAGAGLDVFAIEPLPSQSPLWAMDNVMLTPHVAGLSAGYWPRQGELFQFNLEHYLSGDIASMRNRVDMSKVL